MTTNNYLNLEVENKSRSRKKSLFVLIPGQVSQGGQEKLQADRGGRGLLGLSHQLHQGGDQGMVQVGEKRQKRSHFKI